jgi:hypothetical protein
MAQVLQYDQAGEFQNCPQFGKIGNKKPTAVTDLRQMEVIGRAVG